MERRKISTLGKYSLIVTLPKDWTKMNKLQGGDDVFESNSGIQVIA